MIYRSRPDPALNRPNRLFTPRSLAKFLAFCLSCNSLAAAFSENASARALGRIAQQPAQEPRDVGNKADDEKEALLLEPGKAIKRILAGADNHTYQIRLSAGQFLKVIVEQQGIDVVAQVSGPRGEQIPEFDGEDRSQGQESAWFVAKAEGAYRLRVRPKQKNAPAGGYEIRIEELRDATGDDFALHEARKMLERASKLINAGKYEEALPLIERSREIRERVLGPEHRDVAEALYVLSVLCWNKRENVRAGLLYQQALAIWEKALGPDHPDVALVLSDLANLYRDSGNYARAEALCQRALAVMEKALGPDHLRVATVLNSLALVYWNNGEYAKAEPLHQRSLAIVEKVLGPENTDVARSLNNLAILYIERGVYLKAESLYQRAVAIFEKSLGPDHLNVASSLDNLATVYNRMATTRRPSRSINGRYLSGRKRWGRTTLKSLFLSTTSRITTATGETM